MLEVVIGEVLPDDIWVIRDAWRSVRSDVNEGRAIEDCSDSCADAASDVLPLAWEPVTLVVACRRPAHDRRRNLVTSDFHSPEGPKEPLEFTDRRREFGCCGQDACAALPLPLLTCSEHIGEPTCNERDGDSAEPCVCHWTHGGHAGRCRRHFLPASYRRV